MSKLEEITADLKLAESKKEALRQAFETLKSNAASVASLTLQWSDLDAHFSSLHSSIQSRLEVLQYQLHQIESSTTTLVDLFIHKQSNSICKQVSKVLQSSPSPAILALDAIPLLLKNGKGDFEGTAVKDCLLLLQQLGPLIGNLPKVEGDVREKARRLAVEWKEKMRVGSIRAVMGFLEFLWIYGLVGEFDKGVIFELIEAIAVRNRAPGLCRNLELEEKMPEFIQNLIMKEKEIQAIKFICEFELVQSFPPVDLIKAHLKRTEKAMKEFRKQAKVSHEGQREAANKELAALRAIMKCISKYKLKAKGLLGYVRGWILELENLNRVKETTAAAASTPSPAPSSPTFTAPPSSAKAQPQHQTGQKRVAENLEAQSNWQGGNKRHQTALPAEATPNGHLGVMSMQPHHLQLAGSLTGQTAPHFTAPRHHALPGSAPVNPHVNLFAGQYAFTNFNPVNQYMVPPGQQYGSNTRASSAANLGTAQFNLGGMPAVMAANTNPNWPLPHLSGNVPPGHGYRPATYIGGYGFPPGPYPP